ncbi:MAG: ribosome maturation factor RimM [Neisseriaceae bacterium]|nr:ribosome maturation factor RimM [Neisseriaceae bacterium]
MSNEQLVSMGFVRGVFGVRGWLKISTSTEYSDSLLDYETWQLEKDGVTKNVTVEAGKMAGTELQVKLVGVEDRDQAEALKGYTIFVPRSAFAPTEEDEYYWTDLIGLSVVNQEQVVLGTVTNLMQTGANDVLVLKGDQGQVLIPFVSAYVLDVKLAEQTILVDWDLDY